VKCWCVVPPAAQVTSSAPAQPPLLTRNAAAALPTVTRRVQTRTRQDTRRHFGAVTGTTGKGGRARSSPPCTLLPLQLKNNGRNLYELHTKQPLASETKPMCSCETETVVSPSEAHDSRITSLNYYQPGSPNVHVFSQLLNKLITS